MFAAQAQLWAAVGKVLAGAGCMCDGKLVPVSIDHLPALPGSGELEISFCETRTRAFGALPLHLGDDIWWKHAIRLMGIAVESFVYCHLFSGHHYESGQKSSQDSNDDDDQETSENEKHMTSLWVWNVGVELLPTWVKPSNVENYCSVRCETEQQINPAHIVPGIVPELGYRCERDGFTVLVNSLCWI